MTFSLLDGIRKCRVARDQWHQRFETRSNPHYDNVIGVGDEWPKDNTYPGLQSIQLPRGHVTWLVFRQPGETCPTILMYPAPGDVPYAVIEPSLIKFFGDLFNRGHDDEAEQERYSLEVAACGTL